MKTFKIVLSIFILSLSYSANAQKVKVKKDKVLFDKVAVANFEGSDSGFVFSSLTNEKTITAKFKMLKITDNITKKWVIVSDKDKKRTSEIEMEYFSVTMSTKKAVAELLAKKYNLITNNGIENIDAFFEIERPSLTDEYNNLIKGEVQKTKEISNLNINVDSSAQLIYKGTISAENLIGQYNIKGNGKGVYGSTIITITDLDKNNAAISTLGAFNKFKVSLPYQKKEFEYQAKKKIDFENNYFKSEFLKEMVQNLFSNGVTLGRQITAEKEKSKIVKTEIAKERFEKAQKESINIFEEEGFVINKEGTKVEGKITSYFEMIKTPLGSKSSINEDDINKLVKVKFNDDKGKTQYRRYKANTESKFCVKESNKCYRGIKSFIAYIYVEILEEGSEISLYKSVDSNNFYIKTPENKKPIAIYNNKPKTFKKVSEYLKCEAINDELSRFDFEDSKSMLDLISTYKISCK